MQDLYYQCSVDTDFNIFMILLWNISLSFSERLFSKTHIKGFLLKESHVLM